jgi:2-polyprenyl-6-methoxyphenol hydroxylase-like FAD-dependent oxidoreductase
MQAKFRHLVDAEFPDVRDEVLRSGGTPHSLIGGFASTIADPSPQQGDERFETITARRPVIERAFARVAEDTPGLKVLRGVTVDGPVTSDANGVPRVTGVRTRAGDELHADLVIDAMGRRSKIVDWITGTGGRAPYEEASDAGFAYYTRHYRGSLPATRGSYFTLLSTFSILTLPTDADTWVVVVVCSAGDMPLKAAREVATWERVVRSVPHVQHWLDGEPVQDVYPMAGVLDRYRRFVVDGAPVITGLVAVGDAWACTNPQAGRGITTGLRQVVALRDVVREHADDPRAIVEAFDEVTERTCTPWYRMQVERDRARYASVTAAIEGREPPRIADDDVPGKLQDAFATAAAHDTDVARASLEVFGCLTLPQDVLARPGMIDKVLAASEGRAAPQTPGPSRAELVELLSA